MTTSCLVAYATKHGSTQAVAERVAAILSHDGVDVELRHAREVARVEVYDAVVLGAPIYNGKWHRDGRRFLKRHRRLLRGRPVAVFALGPRTTEDEEWDRSWAQLNRAMDRFFWLEPMSLELFGGVDPPKDKYEPRRDVRDWAAIEVWSHRLGASLRQAREQGVAAD